MGGPLTKSLSLMGGLLRSSYGWTTTALLYLAGIFPSLSDEYRHGSLYERAQSGPFLDQRHGIPWVLGPKA